jgi:hypothetical protein
MSANRVLERCARAVRRIPRETVNTAMATLIGTAIGAVTGGLLVYWVNAEDRRQAAISTAWDRVAAYDGVRRKSGGGLRQAIEYLAAHQMTLRRLYLFDADLFSLRLIPGTALHGVRLAGADLEEAVLPEADMKGARLSGARLVRACLEGANLEGAILSATRLEGQDWPAANLEGADLRGANLLGEDGAWDGVELGAADLRGVAGLTCARLARTRNWRAAYRDPALGCDADIPEPPHTPRCEALEAD